MEDVMRFVVGFGRFWYEFIVGDDWRIAAGVTLVLVAGAVLEAAGVAGEWLPPALALAFVVVFAAPLIAGDRASATGGPAVPAADSRQPTADRDGAV
jgi:small neutral amino acid transporter SnatA (MarC family)